MDRPGPEQPPSVSFQSTFFRVVGLAYGALFLVLGIVLGVLTPWDPAKPLAVIGNLLLAAAFFGRYARLGVYVSAREVKIVRTIRTYRVGWHDVDRFVLKRFEGMSAAHLQTVDGNLIRIEGIGSRRISGRKITPRLAEKMDRMNAALEQYRPKGPLPEIG